ncbi:conserved hypothetical protein [Talaromyces stipitatus ATCC 10500]|uniref:CCHC-type domain-containing protein n=1 Tax=Talaromyces stipitatus (strain ATCC 10500 / CBS 375.48 / QM 6759 / NRRL 1006) TaxID=441959 RepID=B8LU53_TALSN|nr:uncharacterized protein TSTA_060220 [Talaromyces stipitatus ATCC 10500]EED22525.1 conserved hypothetical protein [Talaromyces stipitatus ATCC 10500]
MADAMVEEPATTRSGRVITPSTRAREASGSTDSTGTVRTSKKSMTQIELTAVKKAANLIEEKQSTKDGSKDMLRKICQYLESTFLEVKGLKETLSKQEQMIQEQSEMIRKQSVSIKELQAQLEATQSQKTEECKQLQEQLETISYAGVVATRPHQQQDALRGPPGPPTLGNTLFCTIDTSRVGEEHKAQAQIANIRQRIEKEMRGSEETKTWRCAAMIKDPKNADRVKVICRNEDEIQQVKEAAQKIELPGMRILCDQLYPVKIDNTNRTAVLDADGNILPGAAEALGKENNVNIAKISWLSKKDSHKAYGSMVVYVTKGSDAKRLLRDQYFDIAGESAYTRLFEPSAGPAQCYNCQEIGHKAFSCKKAQTCAKCANKGHHHSTCQAIVLKCVPCGGPHESFSKNCRVRLMQSHA